MSTKWGTHQEKAAPISAPIISPSSGAAIPKPKINRIARLVKPIGGCEKGVLYIFGKNFGSKGGVKVGDQWADIHYRRDDFIIAVVPKEKLKAVVIVAR